MQEKHLIGQPACLPQVMSRHDNPRTSLGDLRPAGFRPSGGGGIETGGGFIQQQHLGFERPGTRQRQALLLATGQDCRAGRPARSTNPACSQGFVDRRPALPPWHAAEAQDITDVGRHGAPEQVSDAETPWPDIDVRRGHPGHATESTRWTARMSPWQRRSSRLLPAPFGPSTMRLGLGLEGTGDVVDEALPCGLKTDLVLAPEEKRRRGLL